MITFENIQKAQKNTKNFIQKTPLIEYGEGIYLKLENKHEEVKAFKIRGAYNTMRSLHDCHKIVTATMGSHGFAIGVAGKKLGIKTTCFMPENTSSEKKKKIQNLVDQVIFSGQDFFSSEQTAINYAKEKKLPFLHPYNDELVIAGQGVIGLEIAEDLPEVTNIYIPIGGGGLLSGIGVAIKKIIPSCQIIGVQPEIMHSMVESFEQNKITTVKEIKSIAEPLAINLNPETITFSYVQKYMDRSILVTENEIGQAMKKIFEKTGDMVEGAGAIALAAAIKDKQRKCPSVCILSGGNIDKERFYKITNTTI